jgi:hypothetical protein
MTPSQFQTHLFQMLRIRRIEEALADRYKEQDIFFGFFYPMTMVFHISQPLDD